LHDHAAPHEQARTDHASERDHLHVPSLQGAAQYLGFHYAVSFTMSFPCHNQKVTADFHESDIFL